MSACARSCSSAVSGCFCPFLMRSFSFLSVSDGCCMRCARRGPQRRVVGIILQVSGVLEVSHPHHVSVFDAYLPVLCCRYLTSRLAKFAVPDDIVFVPEIPHNATGKVRLRLVREGGWVVLLQDIKHSAQLPSSHICEGVSWRHWQSQLCSVRPAHVRRAATHCAVWSTCGAGAVWCVSSCTAWPSSCRFVCPCAPALSSPEPPAYTPATPRCLRTHKLQCWFMEAARALRSRTLIEWCCRSHNCR